MFSLLGFILVSNVVLGNFGLALSFGGTVHWSEEPLIDKTVLFSTAKPRKKQSTSLLPLSQRKFRPVEPPAIKTPEDTVKILKQWKDEYFAPLASFAKELEER